MAEYVQQRIEWMLPELEQMERVGLFTAKEIKYAPNIFSYTQCQWAQIYIIYENTCK